MYRHVKQAVPASRSLTHSCLYLTEGEGAIKIGSETYRVRNDEILFVPAGQVFSFEADEERIGVISSIFMMTCCWESTEIVNC